MSQAVTRAPADGATDAPGRSSGASLRRAVGVTLAFQWTRWITQLLSLVVLARLLEPRDYGMVAMVMSLAGLAAVLGDFGLSLAALRAQVLTEQQKSNLFWCNSAIGIASGVVVAALALPLAAFYNEPRLAPLTLTLALVFPLNGAAVQLKTELNRAGRFARLGAVDAIAGAGGLIAGVATAMAGAGFWALATQQLTVATGTLAAAALFAMWRPGRPRRAAGTRSLLTFGRDTFLVHAANYVTTNLDSVMVGRLLGATALGLYNRAFQLVALPMDQILAPLTRILMPRLASVRGAARDEAIVSLQITLGYLVVGPLGLLAATAPTALPLVLGPQWAAAAPVVAILCVGGVFQVLGYVFYWAFLAQGSTRLLFYSELWGRIPMALLIPVTAHLGIAAVAMSVAIGQVLIWAAGMLRYGPRIGLRTVDIARACLLPLSTALAAFVAGAAAGRLAEPLHSAPLTLGLQAAGWLVTSAVVAAAVPAVRSQLGQAIGWIRRR